jgi:very-long-chain (3R)-3-hydroxyacyl-CoA dehydratase
MAAKTVYLVAYNTVSLLLWDYLALYTVASLTEGTSQSHLTSLYNDILPVLAATQTLALLEVIHAALGLVRASPATTALQIGGKNLVVWTVMFRFPEIVTGSSWGLLGFVGCVLAWGCSEIIRYGYFAVQLISGGTPDWLQWFRYDIARRVYGSRAISHSA